jgi:hypothetical protein
MGRSEFSYREPGAFQRLSTGKRTPRCRVLGFEALEDRWMLAAGTLHGVVSSPNVNIPDNGGNVNMSIALSGAPAGAVITNDTVPSIVDGRLAYHSYTGYGVDGELHVWDFSSSQPYTRAEQAVNARVRYAMNPQISANGRYLVLMGVDRQLPKAWPNLDVFIYDFRNDTVTNLSEALIAEGFLTADWIDEDPSLDPTSLTIAFKRRAGGSSDLWSMRLDGTATTPIVLTRLTNTSSVEESGPKYSPDGQSIVCWIGAGATSWIGTIPAAGGAVSLVIDNANKQDYYPSYWQGNRIIYTSWDTTGSGDDDVRVRDLPAGPDVFGMGGFHSAADDSDPFAISPDLLGFSSTNASADGKWRLWYGNPTTGAVQMFPFHTANKHDLGGVYTPRKVTYVPGPERPELPGDYSFNNVVDAADYIVWRDLLGSTVDLRADGSGPTSGMPDGVVDHYDYDLWRANFGNMLSAGGGALSVPIATTVRVSTNQLSALPEDNVAAAFAAFTLQPPDVPRKPPAEPVADGRLLVTWPSHSIRTSLRVRPSVAVDGARPRRSDGNLPPFDTLSDWRASSRTVGSSAAAVDSPLADAGDAEYDDMTEAYDLAFDLLGSDKCFSAF